MPDIPPEDDPTSRPPRPDSGDWTQATEHLWKTLQGINEWTRFADAKAGAVLTANGVLGTLAAAIVKDNWTYLTTYRVFGILAILFVLPLIVSSGFCLLCLLPKRQVKDQGDSLLFFEHIARESEASYLKSVGALGDDDNAFHEVGKQVWANAKVARKKHREIYWAILLTGWSLPCALVVWIVFFVALLAWGAPNAPH